MWTRSQRLRPNPSGLDDRPPLFDLSLLECGESFRRLFRLRGATSSPRSANRLRTAGSASASTIAPLSLAMMSFGVPLGAKNPNHPDIENPGSPLPSEAGTASPYEFSSAPLMFILS